MQYPEFHWWFGVVEDRNDPDMLGRVRVRVMGYHSASLQNIPREDLPWALPIQPITSAGASGVGHAPVGLVEGSWVFGFFMDGKDAQQPVVIGSLGGVPEAPASPQIGFNDPNGIFPRNPGEADTNRLARNDDIPHRSLSQRTNNLRTGIPTAIDGAWNEPNLPYAAVYPYNLVTEAECGHIFEWDSTPNHERVHLMHFKGTGFEIRPDGTLTQHVVADQYSVTSGNSHQFVEGKMNVTVGEGSKLRVNNEVDIQVVNGKVRIHVDQGDVEIVVNNGNVSQYINGEVSQHVRGNITEQCDGSMRTQVSGNYDIQVSGSLNMRAGTINLN